MSTVDHAILIPMSPESIWHYLGDINNHPQWQHNCVGVNFLTTHHTGRNVRWRQTYSNGRDYVIEITAWYQNLGYEYTIIDGVSYKQNKGRIRLQEIAEGTLVQWTFNYETGGMFGGLRGAKGRIQKDIAESLQNLYQFVMQRSGGVTDHAARNLMRDAPDVEERLHYQPRHEMIYDESQEEAVEEPAAASPAPISMYDEPPVADDDTRPRPSITNAEQIPMNEPDFLMDLPKAGTSAYSRPEPVTDYQPPKEENAEEDMSRIKEILEPYVPKTEAAEESPAPTQEQSVEPPAAPPMQEKPAIPDVPVDTPSGRVEEERTPEPPQYSTLELGKIDLDKLEKETLAGERDLSDTGKISVFEVFGLQKPSETQEFRAVTTTDPVEKEVEPTDTPPSGTKPVTTQAVESAITPGTSRREGLRIRLRRGLYTLRRP